MARGRHKNIDGTVEFKTRIPKSLHRKVKDHLLRIDPDVNDLSKIRTGANSELVIKLLNAWLGGQVEVSGFPAPGKEVSLDEFTKRDERKTILPNHTTFTGLRRNENDS